MSFSARICHTIKKQSPLSAAVLGIALLPQSVLASEINGADTAWILTSTALVLCMCLPGLALFYGGLVRSKNILSVLIQCFAIAGIASVAWLIAGYSLAFSDGGAINGVIGSFTERFMFTNMNAQTVIAGMSIPEPVFAMFQMTFAIITPALIVGGFAERMKFSSVLLFSLLWLFLVYVPVCHWVWGGGFLAELGVLDFAGGIVVHITAGVGALVAAMVIGPRKGFPKYPIPPHNLTMTGTGAGLLWMGWFGFNGGSALGANGDAGMAIIVTHIAAACGAITWMMIEWRRFGKPSALGVFTGMVAGLGTITPASGFVGPGGALILGVLGGVVCFYATQWIKHKLHIDDSLDVFPVHGVGGILGSLLLGVLTSDQLGVFSGVGYNQGMDMASQTLAQLVGILVTFAYTAIVSYVLLKITAWFTKGLRVSLDEETEGLDIVLHEEKGYNQL